MIKGDFAPGFYVRHFIKDMNIALESCESIGLDAKGLSLAKELFGGWRKPAGGGRYPRALQTVRVAYTCHCSRLNGTPRSTRRY